MTTRVNVKLAALLAVTLALTLVVQAAASGAVRADFSPGSRFWGEVTLCGQSVPPGTEIIARIHHPDTGPLWDDTTSMRSIGQAYVIDVPPFDPSIPQDGGVPGETVYFSVKYEDSAFTQVIQGPSSTWQSFGYIYHPLRLCLYLGDANMDGVIDGGDITKVQRIIWGLDPPTPTADANNDGVIDAGDITRIRQIIWGLVDPISCCGCS